MEFNKNLTDCAIIKVEVKEKNIASYGYNYSVRIKDIEETMKFLSICFKEFGINYSRIYLSGFALLTENSIWTKERIAESIKNEANRIYEMEQNSNILVNKKMR